MKKIIVGSLLVLGAVSFVSAEQSQGKEQMRPMPIKAEMLREAKRIDGKSSSTPPMRKEMEKPRPPMASSTPLMGEGMITGDPVIDGQVRTLKKEMDDKIKAIRSEYEAKIKTLIGEKKLVRASSTDMKRDDMREKMEHGTGTPMRMEGKDNPRPTNASGTPPVRVEKKRPLMPLSNGPTGMIKNFFQSFFGGSPIEAQAEVSR
jgi:hypothetical protein